jgi:hypothetical protein
MRIFVSQSATDRWVGAGGLVVDGEMMRFHAAPHVALYINPAVYFERVDGADSDPYDIIGAVKTRQELAQMGADHYETSVVLGEFAYTVKPGFVATTVGSDGSETQLDGQSWGTLLVAMETLGTG